MEKLLYSLGLILMIAGGSLLIPVPVALIYGEFSLIPNFLIPAGIAFILGIPPYKLFDQEQLVLGKAMALTAIGWVSFSAFGSIPFITSNGMTILESFFESMSGFTATGLTVMQGTEGWVGGIPSHTIMFWRSLTQWIGGLGVVVLFLAIFPATGTIARKLYESEARTGNILPSIKGTVRAIWKIYLLYTLIGIIGLIIAGTDIFPAINHSMTGIATGGYSVTPSSYADYSNPILGVTIVIMIAGGISFQTHRSIISGNWRDFFKSPEIRLMFILIGISSLALFWSVGLSHSLFQPISALTGTGFSSTGFIPDNWTSFQKGILTLLMVIGGGYGSTSSAIKLMRTVTILGAVYWLIRRSFLPDRAVVPMKISGKVYSESDIMESAVYAFIYIILLTGCSLILMAALSAQWSGVDAVFESASAQGNVGLSVGITAVATPFVRIILIIQMLAGRLEILPVLALFRLLTEKIPRRERGF